MRLIRSAQIAAAVAAFSLAAACTTASTSDDGGQGGVSGGGGDAVTADKTYKLGLGLPLTGPAAAYGTEYRNVVEMAIDDVNKQYAKDGIKLELVTADTQATAEGGVSAMNKLGAVDKAPAVLTGWGTVLQATIPIASDLDFAILNAGVQNTSLIGQSPELVNLLPMNKAMFEDFADYLVNERGYKTFAYVAIDTDTGQEAAKEFADAVEAAGGKLVATESIRQDATDATAQIAKIKDADPDFMYFHTLLVDGASVMKAAKEANLRATIGSYNAVGEARLIRDAGADKSNGLLYVSHLPSDVDAVKGLLGKLETKMKGTGLVNQSYDPYWYSAPFLYAEAIKRLRADGAPVTGGNITSVLGEATDIEVPIIGPIDLTDQLTYKTPTTIREIADYKGEPLNDKTVAGG